VRTIDIVSTNMSARLTPSARPRRAYEWLMG
jgi:hypothetical protein